MNNQQKVNTPGGGRNQLKDMMNDCDNFFKQMNLEYKQIETNQIREISDLQTHVPNKMKKRVGANGGPQEIRHAESQKMHDDSFQNNYDFLGEDNVLNNSSSMEKSYNSQNSPLHEYLGNSESNEDQIMRIHLQGTSPPQKQTPNKRSQHANSDPQNDADMMNTPINEEQEDDAITNAINKLKFHMVSFGFPDFGNLRSSKKKDIRARIKSIASMLKQRQKDLEYRQQYDPQFLRLKQDRDMYEDKYKKAISKAKELDKEIYALKVQIKDKDDQVKSKIEQQKSISKGVTGNTTKMEQKITLLQCEMKKMETQNTKLQEQIKRLMGLDKVYYQNTIEATCQAQNGQGLARIAPDNDFLELIKQGSDLQNQRLHQENAQLKDCLVIMQQELKEIMQEHFMPIFNAAPLLPKLLEDLQLTSQKYSVQQILTPLMLNVPQNTNSLQNLCKVFSENMKKLKHFYTVILNPISVCKVIMDINTIIADNGGQYKPILRYEELKKVLRVGFDKQNLEQRQPNFKLGDDQQNRGKSNNGGGNNANSVNRKKWGVSPHQNNGTQQQQQQQEKINMRKGSAIESSQSNKFGFQGSDGQF